MAGREAYKRGGGLRERAGRPVINLGIGKGRSEKKLAGNKVWEGVGRTAVQHTDEDRSPGRKGQEEGETKRGTGGPAE